MAQSIELEDRIKRIRMNAVKYRSKCPTVLNDGQFIKLLAGFEKYANENGWYRELDVAIERNSYFFYDWQWKYVTDILRSVFQKKGYTIAMSVKRQEGKTELAALALIFCYKNYYPTFGYPFNVGVITPSKAVGNDIFKRLKNFLATQSQELAVNKVDYIESLRGDSLAAFSIADTGATIEGKTLNFLLRDESHAGSDKRWRDEVLWTTAARDGVTIVMLGCAGYAKCDFSDILTGEVKGDFYKIYIYGYNELKPYIDDLAEKGYSHAENWNKRTERLVRMNGGWDSEETKKNVFCLWQFEIGNYMTREQIMECATTSIVWNKEKPTPLVSFIDMGYSGDQSVVTVMDMNMRIIDWIILKPKNKTMALREQLELFIEISDALGYTANYKVIGIDSSGLGRGAMEMLTRMTPAAVEGVSFPGIRKHEMYMDVKNHVITDFKQDRIQFNINHDLANQFILEITEIEQKINQAGYFSFHAPEGRGMKMYDDMPDSLAGCLHILLMNRDHFTGLNTYSHRRKNNSIYAPPALKQMKKTARERNSFAGRYL